jgi:histidinol phosphatase-like enzyme (inositol monophosphatase family)
VTVSDTELVATMHLLADVSATAILPHFRELTTVVNKATEGRFDPVTEADRAAEAVIRDTLASRFPEHTVFGEEFENDHACQPSHYRWVIDPIDGTRAFVLGLPTWGTLIGLEEAGAPKLGLMNQPYIGERFWTDGKSSYFKGPNGRTVPIRTRSTQLETARLSTTAPELFAPGDEQAAFRAVNARVQERRYGADCYAYCLLAAGHIDIVIEAGLKPYDIVALIPIIENAGGIVTDWNGGPAGSGGRVLACGDETIHAAVREIIAETIESL